MWFKFSSICRGRVRLLNLVIVLVDLYGRILSIDQQKSPTQNIQKKKKKSHKNTVIPHFTHYLCMNRVIFVPWFDFFLFVFNVFFCDIIDTEAFTIIFMCLFPSSGRYRMEQRLAVIVVSSLPIFLFYSISLFLSLAPSLWVTSRNHLPHNGDISIFSVMAHHLISFLH